MEQQSNIEIHVGQPKKLRYSPIMIDANLISKVKEMTSAERLELIEAVWETINLEEVPVTAAERSFLDERIADAHTNPGDESSWSDVRARLKRKLP